MFPGAGSRGQGVEETIEMTLVRGCENGNRTDRNRLEKGIPGSDVSMSRFCLTRLLSMYIYICKD